MSQIYDQFNSIIEKASQTEKGDMICTRLILSAAIGAVMNNGFQRGSERTICPGKWTNRTVKGGARPVLLPVPIHARAVIKADTQFQQKEDATRKGCIL